MSKILTEGAIDSPSHNANRQTLLAETIDMKKLITGIHHVTALAADAQQNVDFYAGILGTRLVKKTVNFDAPNVYHLYYGDESGLPGSILTFFPYQGLTRGRQGLGMLNVTSFSVPISSLSYWLERLKKFNIAHEQPVERFGSETAISLSDPDGLGLELVFNNKDPRPGFTYGAIPAEHAVRGFYGVEIWEGQYEDTAELLTGQLDHKLIAEAGNRYRFAATDSPGNYVDIIHDPKNPRGLSGSGTVHHIAFCTPDKESQLEVREKISRVLLNPTTVIDRQYFHSIYFREPGGVLFEVATVDPGFAVDEDKAHLGEVLKLPAWYESNRQQIQNALPDLTLNIEKFK